MSRIPKWKIEKSKVKVVFRLQFHATHIPQPGWDKLFVSFIPADTGKVTGKTTKANVRNGTCKWSDPIYETTRLLHDPKTKEYEEKLYKLAVAMGSSRSSMLGEVVINLADFADALKPSSAAFPLHGCDSGTILHVTVQLLTSKTGFREFEQQRELSVKGFQTSSGKISHEVVPANFGATGHMDKVKPKARFKGSSTGLPSLEEVGELDEEYEDSAAGVDGSSCTSESLYADKNDVSSIPEIDSIKSRVSGDLVVFSANCSSSNENEEHNYKQLSTQLGNDWIQGWNSDYSIDKDLASTCEDTDSLTARLQVAESAFLQLNSEAKSLQNISDELSAETHHLSQQLAMEVASGEKLTREVNILKSECWKFRNDLEELKVASVALHISTRKIPSTAQLKCCQAEISFENNHVDSVLDVVHSSLPGNSQSKLLQGLFLVECKARQVQNKACFGCTGSQFEYLYSEFGVLVSLIENLKQIIADESSIEPADGIPTIKNQYSWISQSENYAQEQGVDLCHSEGIKEEKMCELQEQLDASKAEVASLTKRMSQMECYYEALIDDLKDGQKQAADQMENLRAEHSSCFNMISALQNQVENLHQEMNGQLIRFSEDRHNLEISIKALEKRAISSESMLKRVRWNYAIAVDRLQKDLELLSFQVLSMYEANENLAKQVVSDASQQHGEHLEEMQLWHRGESLTAPNQKKRQPASVEVQQDIVLTHNDRDLYVMLNDVTDEFNHRMLNFTSDEENKGGSRTGLPMSLEFHIKDVPNAHVNALKLNSIPSAVSRDVIRERKEPSFSYDSSIEKTLLQNLEVRESQLENHLADDKVGSEEMDMSLYVPKQLHESIGAEILEEHMLNMHWEVYSEALQETLRELFAGTVLEHEQKREHCTNEKEFMSLKLIAAMDEARRLRDAEAKCYTKFNELVSKNHIMEIKLNEALDENSCLVQKMIDCHSLIAECRVYESKYNLCAIEKNELQNMLQEENSQRKYLQSNISSISEEFKSLMERYDNQCSLNSDLQRGVTHLQGKLKDLCNGVIFLNQQINDSILDNVPVKEELNKENYDAIVSHLENFQQKVCCRLLELQQEKKVAEELREVAQCTLNKTESELEEIRMKVELSSTKAQHLKMELEEALGKLSHTTEAEKSLQMENRELLSKMSILEVELQQATDECQEFCQKLLAADSVNEELAKTKLSLMDFTQENRRLLSSIHSGNEVTIKMENELSSLKESLHYAHDKLQFERKLREELEVAVSDLKLLLEKASKQLSSFDEKNAELCYLRMRVVDLEGDLHQYEMYCQERERNIYSETSSLRLQAANAETYLIAAIEHSLSADVEITFMRNQLIEFFVYQKRLKSNLEELHLKHINAVVLLEEYRANESELTAERDMLLTDLQSEKSRVEVFYGERESLLGYKDANTEIRSEYDYLKATAAVLEADYAKEKHQYEGEICKLKSMLVGLEALDELWLSKVELDILVKYLGSKLSEQHIHISLHEECDYEMRKLREQHIELNQKLSEQILKTEEFKNLSIHLRELKDKAGAECYQACERREPEGSSLAVQDSLRIAFIKEQYESKVQELRNQCSVSRKYAEEMLMKLQSSFDENETRMKNEASLAKRNDEMSILLSDLNSELKTVVADRRELIIAYDRMKAELECTILSLECCKEEKQKLQNSLKESSEEREKIKVELDLVRHLFENIASTTETRLGRNYDVDNPDARLIELLEDGRPGISVIYHETSSALGFCSEGDQVAKAGTVLANETTKFRPCSEIDNMQLNSTNGDSYLSVRLDQAENLLKEAADKRSTLLENNATQIADIKERFKEQQRLITGMGLLHEQLQRLRDENLSSDFELEEHGVSADLQCLQRDLSQLEMANGQLRSIFPAYERLTCYGNAIERVLALELELAESLQVKKKSEIRFQSSFLKQHSDDEAVFQSFRDINELIKDMLELKKRNAAVETELLEMHGRYSQLSLQFAEVEGERQKLVMSLKNRSPRKS